MVLPGARYRGGMQRGPSAEEAADLLTLPYYDDAGAWSRALAAVDEVDHFSGELEDAEIAWEPVEDDRDLREHAPAGTPARPCPGQGWRPLPAPSPSAVHIGPLPSCPRPRPWGGQFMYPTQG